MIALQEELDWEVYRLYGLVDEDLTTGDEPEPPLQLGERAFEIVLARKMAAGEEETTWFARHGSTPITELPAHWPEAYRRLVERRIELIESDLNIGLIERPEYKRRWAAEPWDEQVQAALRALAARPAGDAALLARAGRAHVDRPARRARRAPTRTSCRSPAVRRARRRRPRRARRRAGQGRGGAVPRGLPLHRLGPAQDAQWQRHWELQRREDAGEDVGDDPGAAEVHQGRLPRRARGTTAASSTCPRSGSSPTRAPSARPTRRWCSAGPAGTTSQRAQALATWYLQAKRDGRDASTSRRCSPGWPSWCRGCSSGTTSRTRPRARPARHARSPPWSTAELRAHCTSPTTT